MIRFTLIIYFVFNYSLLIQAQKEDYNWIIGYSGTTQIGFPDSDFVKAYGNSILKFNGTSFDTSRYWYGGNISNSCASISDSDGNLLFYTNWAGVYTRSHKLMLNGDNLTPGPYRDDWIELGIGVYTSYAVMIIPFPNDKNKFYIFHSDIGSLEKNFICQQILYSIVDMSLDSGRGKVTVKNAVLMDDKPQYALNAVKHKNGKDWWIMIPKLESNIIQKVLIDSAGIHFLKDTTNVTIKSNQYSLFVTTYSPNGSKYAYLDAGDGLSIFDFNRCDGSLSNERRFDVPDILDSTLLGLGLSFSPNGRFLYMTMSTKIQQYDLWEKDKDKIIVEVAYYDGFEDTLCKNCGALGTYFHQMQIAPDNKIYISTGNTTRYLHTIDKPDLKGIACDVRQHSIRTPTFQCTVPLFPNYHLGASEGCYPADLSEVDKVLEIKLFPNPTSDFIHIDIEPLSLKSAIIFDMTGKEILISYENKIDVSSLSNRVYTIHITSESGNHSIQKIIKQ